MQFSRHWLRYSLLSALLGSLAACGGSDDSDATTGGPLAVSSSPSLPAGLDAARNGTSPTALPATIKGAGDSKREPVSRPGAEAPMDSARDSVSKLTGTRLFATGFETGVSLAMGDGVAAGNGDQYLVGGDLDGFRFPAALGKALAASPSRVNAEVGDIPSMKPQDFAVASIETVAGRDGAPTRVMSLHSKAKSRAIDAQQISIENAGLSAEPVVYQRMWIKFDAGTLARATQYGADRFYQTFWEVKGKADFWLRLKLQLDPVAGLVWVAKANGVAGAERSWSTRLSSAPVTIASNAEPSGWHKVEIWLDSIDGRFKVSIDGHPLVDRGDVHPAGGDRIDAWRMMLVGSSVAPLAQVLFDDLEFWDLPPADAFDAAVAQPAR